MKKQSFRPERVGQQILREIAQLMQFEIKDPRLEMVNIIDVEMSRDLSHAKVFFSVLDARDVEEALVGFEKSQGFIRKHLGKTLKLRVTPELHFHYDTSLATGNRLSKAIDDAIAEDKEQHSEDE